MPGPKIKRACIAAAVLFSVAVYGSFGAAPCRDAFACHFFRWGVLVGLAGIPISGLIFPVLHLGFCSRARSKLRQSFLGGFIGMVVYAISAACGALIGASRKAAPGQQTDYPLIGFVSTYLVLAIASVLDTRSNPRHRLLGKGGDAD